MGPVAAICLVMYTVLGGGVYGAYKYYTIEESDQNKPFIEHKGDIVPFLLSLSF